MRDQNEQMVVEAGRAATGGEEKEHAALEPIVAGRDSALFPQELVARQGRLNLTPTARMRMSGGCKCASAAIQSRVPSTRRAGRPLAVFRLHKLASNLG